MVRKKEVVAQAILLVAFAGTIAGAWGAAPGAPTRDSAIAFLRIKALGSPITVLLLVLQARLLSPDPTFASPNAPVIG